MESSFPLIANPKRILLGPGPSMADPRVLQALGQPLIGHLDPEFLKVMTQIQEMLRIVFETKNELTLAVPGTGTAAMETAVASVVEKSRSILVCVKGYFGNRIAEMAKLYEGDVTVLTKPMGEIFHPEEIQKQLKKKPAQIIAIVQAETSSGVLQPLKEISKIVHSQGGILLVDAVTSMGGVPVSVDGNEIDICYSCSQKCLGCPPGISPITYSPTALEFIQKRKSPIANWYLDINKLSKYWGSEHIYHHTASSSLVYALSEGIRIIMEEGLITRYQRHLRNARLLWQGLEELDLSLLVPEANRLPTLTTVRIPEGFDDLTIRRQLLNEFNIEIGGGLGELKGKIWRIGLMGYSSRSENILLLLDAFKQFLTS
jgi:alanine-glyoxylate transaminase / serine-glyoxylate transaminase / serine-pyruvate transaminase